MNSSRRVAVLLAAAMLAICAPVAAQVPPPAPQAAAPAPISQDLLDSLLAPIALYPDQLLTQILMASTYPLEVVEAARFVKANPDLKGAALDESLKGKNWDASVLSLAAFPQILDMMNDKLEWTQRLGDAFLDDEAAVMRTVQSLRWKAQQAGNLQSTEQQKVIVQEKTIIIEPAQPQYVYIPVYNPTVIYGPWWAPAYSPWFWYPPLIWGYPPYRGTVVVGFYWGPARVVTVNNWGWCQPNWGGSSIHININNSTNIWVNRPQYHNRYQNGNWNHNVEHRRGVAYRDTATGTKYRPTNSAGVQTRENYRGRDGATRPSGGSGNNAARPSPGTPERPAPGTGGGAARPSPGTPERPTAGAGGGAARPSPGTPERPAPGAGGGAARPSPAPAARPAPGAGGGAARPSPAPAARPAPGAGSNATRPAPSGTRPAPAYRPESRPQVQRDAARGAQSRAAMQQRPAPSASRGGGGGGGGQRQGR